MRREAMMRSGALTRVRLARESARHAGTGGASEVNRDLGFRPAFLDHDTGVVYESRFADGRQAPVHVLDGLPDCLVQHRRADGRVASVRGTVEAGFVRAGRFYTREDAARVASAPVVPGPQ
jgi:hypothetical protein